jgi:hypothetical protein
MTDLLGAASDQHHHGCKRLIRLPPSWQVEATFDGPGGCWRYLLLHRWGPGPLALYAMMNPSGADLHVGDATVMKTSRISMRLGYGGQIVVNACAYRGVQPKVLLTVADPVGPKNLATIERAARDASLIVVAHGNLPPRLQHQADAMVAVLQRTTKPLHVLGLSGDGVPMHPLARGKNAIRENVIPQPWTPNLSTILSPATTRK